MWENNHDIIREWWNTINRHSPTQRRQAAGRQAAGSQADVVILDVVAAASQSCSLKAVSQPLRHTTNQPTQRNVDVGLLTPRFLVVTIALVGRRRHQWFTWSGFPFGFRSFVPPVLWWNDATAPPSWLVCSMKPGTEGGKWTHTTNKWFNGKRCFERKFRHYSLGTVNGRAHGATWCLKLARRPSSSSSL